MTSQVHLKYISWKDITSTAHKYKYTTSSNLTSISEVHLKFRILPNIPVCLPKEKKGTVVCEKETGSLSRHTLCYLNSCIFGAQNLSSKCHPYSFCRAARFTFFNFAFFQKLHPFFSWSNRRCLSLMAALLATWKCLDPCKHDFHSTWIRCMVLSPL